MFKLGQVNIHMHSHFSIGHREVLLDLVGPMRVATSGLPLDKILNDLPHIPAQFHGPNIDGSSSMYF